MDLTYAAMIAEFQSGIDAKLSEFSCAHALIDDIFVISKGSEIEHIALAEKNAKKNRLKKHGAEIGEVQIREEGMWMFGTTYHKFWHHTFTKQNRPHR